MITREEIEHRIALLLNPMPDMSGNNINRFHGERRRQIERLAMDICEGRSAQVSDLPECVVLKSGSEITLFLEDDEAATRMFEYLDAHLGR